MTLDELLTEWALDQICPNSRELTTPYELGAYRNLIHQGSELLRRLRIAESDNQISINDKPPMTYADLIEAKK